MKKILALIIFTFISITCGSLKTSTSWKNVGMDGYMVEEVDKIVSIKELYQICEKENLTTDLKKWGAISYKDDMGEVVSQWFYIKDTDTNKFYLLTKDTDSTFTIKIRNIMPD